MPDQIDANRRARPYVAREAKEEIESVNANRASCRLTFTQLP
ncbi:MAG TPA: hypothetical protein VGQ12_03525 [Candidatus Angelobacter sp.]|nr:hypothetical protein [Candidatus Angelobacter sp.]